MSILQIYFVICFYNPKAYKKAILNDLIACFNQYIEDDIIRWKMVRAFESFDTEFIKELLADIEKNDEKEIIRIEARRSLGIINGYI